MNKAKIVTPQGVKALSLASDSQWVDFLLEKKNRGDATNLFHKVPWLHRAVEIRSHAMASLPFAIKRGDKVIDGSRNYQNQIKFLPDPSRLLAQLEGALTLFGSAYILNAKNRVQATKVFRYLNPTTIKPLMDSTKGLTGFERRIGNKKLRFDVEDLVYIWGIDPSVEFAPPSVSPATVALSAAGVMLSVDEFATKFFDGGAVKATVFSVSGGTPPAEREKFKNWLQRFLSGGVRNAFNIEVMNDDVNTTVIGEGIQELANTALTTEKREEIATALGVPHSLLHSNAANFATAKQDANSFMQRTIMPEAEIIQQALNSQVFSDMGLTFEFQPEASESFQEEERERAGAYLNYVNAKMPPAIAGQILGIDLPEGMTWDEFKVEQEAWLEKVGEAKELSQESEISGAEQKSLYEQDIIKWRRKSLKAHKAGKNPAVKFTSEHIDNVMNASIFGVLQTAKTRDQIIQAFNSALEFESYP